MTLELFLPDDNPRGVRIVRLKGRTVFAMHVPRAHLSQALKRDELDGVGVYFLLRHEDGEPVPRVYIGEAENCGVRLKQHDGQKDFWTHAIVVLDKDDFTKAHARYLEWRCEGEARRAGRYTVENSVVPGKPKLPEATESALLDAFHTLDVLVTTLGAPLFEPYTAAPIAPLPVPVAAPVTSALPLPVVAEPVVAPISVGAYFCHARGADARAIYDNGGLIVCAGSRIAPVLSASGIEKGILEARAALLKAGGLVTDEGVLRFAQDHRFHTPSGAADFVMGSSANGWREWKTAQGIPLDALRKKAGA